MVSRKGLRRAGPVGVISVVAVRRPASLTPHRVLAAIGVPGSGERVPAAAPSRIERYGFGSEDEPPHPAFPRDLPVSVAR
jgi:hypothetical protein